MEASEAKLRIEELRRVIEVYSRHYYVENAPLISDFEFDGLMRELESLEKTYPEFDDPDSPTHKVGSDLKVDSDSDSPSRQTFVQRPHRYPMLSLSNTYSVSEIEEFSLRAERAIGGAQFGYCCELKFDGTAICLTYKNGKLVQALTRGDGVVGDDITENALRIRNLPRQLKGDFPEEFEIRGEVLMPYESFEALNKERELKDEPPFANPRNAASGSLKLLNPEEVEHRGLVCTLYHIPAESLSFSTHWEAMDAAASWGLPVSDERRLCHNISEIRDYLAFWDEERKKLPYATDGVVIKINELEHQLSLGQTAKFPRWAVAFKFKAETACTKILSIDYQVGRTGAVTPVANLEPVQLSGTIVKRATLNNADMMEQMDIRVGDYVYVEKGGEIIPKISGVELGMRSPDSVKAEFPKLCPDCSTPLVRNEEEARWFCPNQHDCPMQIKGRMLHFSSRKAMDILAGEATVEQLYLKGLAKQPSDLYILSANDLMALEGWKEKSVSRFLESIDASRKVPFERVLYAIGIRYVGESTAKLLAAHFENMDRLMEASKEELLQVEDVGEVIASSVYEFMRDPLQIEEISKLKAAGLQFALSDKPKALSSSLEGKTVVISGNFSISRDEMKAFIASHGGKLASSVSKKSSFLLAGSKPGPEKLRQCEKLGIAIISEQELREMVSDSRTNELEKQQEAVVEQTLF